MRQLSDQVILSKSGVTRLIDRLVADGLVERSTCLADARGAEAVLTDDGLTRLRAASRTHLRGITEHFLDPLERTDVVALEGAMRAISVSAGPGHGAVLPGRPERDRSALTARHGGRLYVGTSGFAYPGWIAPVLPHGSARRTDSCTTTPSGSSAVELNNTYYQPPKPDKVDAWLAATPETFRFTVKAQRGGSFRTMTGDPTESVPWLTDPYRRFGERLGTVLLRVPDGRLRDDARLRAALALWPRDLPLTMEFPDPSWHVDETFAALADAGAALCTTELPEHETPPDDPSDRVVPVPAPAAPRLQRSRAGRLGGSPRTVPGGGRRRLRLLPP